MVFENQQSYSTAISQSSSNTASYATTNDLWASKKKTKTHIHSPSTDTIYNQVLDKHFPTEFGQLQFKQPHMLYILLTSNDPDVQEVTIILRLLDSI